MLFDKLRRKPQKTGTPAVADGLRLYAVGDIHGRADLLAELHDAIVADAIDHDGEKRIVYLGDFIDRGMESRRVVVQHRPQCSRSTWSHLLVSVARLLLLARPIRKPCLTIRLP